MRTGTWAVLAAVLVVAAMAESGQAGVVGDAIERAGDRLVAQQAGNGSWAGETGFTGSIVAGLVNAYSITGDASYKTAAESGGTWILNNSSPNFYGDEAYALTGLSSLAADPGSNAWRTAASGYYAWVQGRPGGTAGYISAFSATNPSNAVFYLSPHAVAANYVSADDKALWHQGVIDFLATVDDSTADYPVMALGAATWALAQSGAMDGTLVDPSAPSGSTWDGVTLADLPGMLAGHQVASGDNAGSFFWRFDHAAPSGGDPSGFTEDTVFGTLGLIAADDADPSLGYDDEILAARTVLAGGVATDGKVYEHIWSGGMNYHTYAGETLEALPEPATLGLLAAGGLVGLMRRRRRPAGT